MEIQFLKQGNKIHIKKSNEGKFTDYCGGKVTQKCIQKAKSSGNKKLIKRATFAENAKKWNHPRKHLSGGFFNQMSNFLGSNSEKLIGGIGKAFNKDNLNGTLELATQGINLIGNVASAFRNGSAAKEAERQNYYAQQNLQQEQATEAYQQQMQNTLEEVRQNNAFQFNPIDDTGLSQIHNDIRFAGSQQANVKAANEIVKQANKNAVLANQQANNSINQMNQSFSEFGNNITSNILNKEIEKKQNLQQAVNDVNKTVNPISNLFTFNQNKLPTVLPPKI